MTPSMFASNLVQPSGLTYAGWQGDVERAEHHHVIEPLMFDSALEHMQARKAIHTGDRSHPQLCALDALVASGLTYAGWQEDVKKAEEYHKSMYTFYLFDPFLAEMGGKERSQQGIVPPPQSGGKQLAAAMLSNPAQNEAGPVLQQAPSPAQTGNGKAAQPGRKRIADSADPNHGEEEGRQRESKKTRKAGASGGAETGEGGGSEGGLRGSEGVGWQADIQERFRELEAKEAEREKRDARLEERMTKLEEKVVMTNSQLKQAQEELARLHPEQVDLTGEDDEDKRLGQGANGGQEGAGRAGSGSGGREMSGMALLAQAQQRTLQVKRERDDAEEERHEEGTYSALFINGLQTQIDALRGMCAARGITASDVHAALSGSPASTRP